MLNDKYFDTFTMFTWEHYIPVLIVFFIVALIFLFRQSLIESKSKYTIGLILVGVTLGLEILINMWRVYAGAWSVTTSLPLHLSSFSAYLSMYLLLTRRQKLFNVTFFLMIIGALLALVTPGIQGNWGFPHFRYFHFFAIHGMLVINVAYMLFVYQFSEAIRYKHIWLNALSLLVLAAFLFPLNVVLGSNYLFLMAKPGPNTAFDLFGPWPWYLINIAWAGVPIFFHLFYIPFYLTQKRKGPAITRVKSEI